MTTLDGVPAGALAPAGPGPGRPAGGAAISRRSRRRALTGALALLIVVGVFGFALPRLASYRAVWLSLTDLSWTGLVVILAALAASQITTWWMITAVLPRLRLRQAAVVNLSSSAVANTVPGGGAVALGVSWAMLSGWQVSTSQYVQYTLVSGLWNVFARLGLPAAAVALIAIGGHASPAWQAGACAGAALMALTAAGLWGLLRSASLADRADRALARLLKAGFKLVRRRPPGRTSGLVVDLRAGARELLANRWLPISAATLASHLTLWLVLLACLRASGVPGSAVPWTASLAAFAFVRLLSVLPITPGGLGVVELGLAGPLAAGLEPGLAARVAAAVLLFRSLTYLLPLPAGAIAYGWWRLRSPRRALD